MTTDVSVSAQVWATTSGDAWSRWWRETDRGLEVVGEHLLSAITACAPESAFKAFEIGCGPGSTSIAVGKARPDARITACDISSSLLEVARARSASIPQIRFLLGDAAELAADEGPFDLIFSRHGVMFFADPVAAFRQFRAAAKLGGALIFSCFQCWESNPWAWELTDAAAGGKVPPPGREPGGFAFADQDYVRDILIAAGWDGAQPDPLDFTYVVGEGGDAVEEALSFVLEIGPAARLIQSMPEQERPRAVERTRGVIEGHFDGARVTFPAAAWIWKAKTAPAA